MSEGAREHDWFLEHVELHEFGLLLADERRRFVEHGRQCPDCRQMRRRVLTDLRSRLAIGGHIPARLLACWDRAQGRLGLQARVVVESHLGNCAECRDDLAFSSRMRARARAGLDPAKERSPVGPNRALWLRVASAGGMLATAAALMFVTARWLHDPGDVPMKVEKPAPAPPLAASPPRPAPVIVELRPTNRGSEEALVTLPIDTVGIDIGLRMPELYLPARALVEVFLVDPIGRHSRLYRGKVGTLRESPVILSGVDSLRAGMYRVEVRTAESPQSVITTYPIRLRAQ